MTLFLELWVVNGKYCKLLQAWERLTFRPTAGGFIFISSFEESQFGFASLRASYLDPGLTWSQVFYSFHLFHSLVHPFVPFHLPTSHKNDQDDGIPRAIVSWKIQPEMPRNDSVPVNPCHGLWGPLVGEVGGESLDFSFRTLPGYPLSIVRLLVLLHRVCPAWKIKSNWWEAYKKRCPGSSWLSWVITICCWQAPCFA